MITKKLLLFASCLLLCNACESTPSPTQETFNRLNKLCHDKLQEDVTKRRSDRLTRWMKCKQTHIMPLEIILYPFKEEEIHEMYAKLVSGAQMVDQGQLELKALYDEWDSMQLQIGLRPCTMTYITADNSYKCMDAGVFNGS